MFQHETVKQEVLRVLSTASNTGKASFSTDEQQVITEAILAALQAYDRTKQD